MIEWYHVDLHTGKKTLMIPNRGPWAVTPRVTIQPTARSVLSHLLRPYNSQIRHWPKFQKLHMYSIQWGQNHASFLPKGVTNWAYFRSTGSSLQCTGMCPKPPYFGIKLGHLQQFQKLDINSFYPRGSKLSCFSLYRQPFLRYGPIFKIAMFGNETWQVAKVPEVAHIPSFYPKGSKLFLLYGQRFPRYRPIFMIAIFGHETLQVAKVLEHVESARIISFWPKGKKLSLFSLYGQRLNSFLLSTLLHQYIIILSAITLVKFVFCFMVRPTSLSTCSMFYVKEIKVVLIWSIVFLPTFLSGQNVRPFQYTSTREIFSWHHSI